MNEIEKMYENANVEKEVIKGCYDYYSKLGIDIWKENDCGGKNCDTCKKDKSIKRYPPFTAEKQIELIKWLCEHYLLEIRRIKDTQEYYIGFNSYKKRVWNATMNFENTLAKLINNHWQDLTEEERKQIKIILQEDNQ